MKIRVTNVLVALILMVVTSAEADDLECSQDAWVGCLGKPWVVGDEMPTPLGKVWWPHPLWGAEDQAGSTNWYKNPEVVLRALAEADKGEVYSLGRFYDADMPLFGARKFSLRILGSPTGGPLGSNKIIWNDEFLATEVGQVGTQLDGLGHIGVQTGEAGDKSKMLFYNGFTAIDIEGAYGLKRLGVEKLHPIMARGVLLDIAATKGTESLDSGYEITMDDISAALEMQGMKNFEFHQGDAVFFHTGWGKLWGVDNDRFKASQPGIGMEVAKWISDEVQAGVVGSDTWATEVVPSSDPRCVFCVHQHLIVRHGIVNHENMTFESLLRAGVYVFLYSFSPAPIVGATGSMGAPIALD